MSLTSSGSEVMSKWYKLELSRILRIGITLQVFIKKAVGFFSDRFFDAIMQDFIWLKTQIRRRNHYVSTEGISILT